MGRLIHLDNIYRNRYQEYYTADGRKFDSRKINWRQVEWDRLVAVVTYIRDKKYLTHCKVPDFKFFIVYRWAGHRWVLSEKRKIHEWAVGWSNGIYAFMTDFDFKTGEQLRQYVVPIEKVKEHIHPRILMTLKRKTAP